MIHPSFLVALTTLPVFFQDPRPVTLRFGWPREGAVRVRESSLKQDNTAEIAYTLRWSSDEAGDSFVIAYEDFRFLAMNGKDASTPELQAVIGRLGPLMKAIPRMRISSEGQLVEFLGLDEVFEAVLAELPEEERDAELEARLRSPEARRLATAAAAERWSVWVAGLIGTETFEGEERQTEVELPSSLPDRGLRAVQSFRCADRFVDDGVECVRLEMETDFDSQSLTANARAMAESLGHPIPAETAESLKLTRRDRVQGTWEVETLRPRRVKTSTVVRSGQREQREEHEYVFDWSED